MPPSSETRNVRGRKAEATRARILDAAAEVLSTHGYAGTRLADVGTAAHVAAPAIYYHFASREALIEEVVHQGASELRAHVEVALETVLDAPALDRIDAAVAAHLRYGLRESAYARAALRNARTLPDELLVRYRTEMTAYGRLWTALVQAAVDEGVLRSDLPPDSARRLVLGALNWTPEWWQSRRATIDRMVAQAQLFVRSALAAA